LNGIYLDDEAGVRFTLYELKKELRSRGHDINLQSLIESLNICNRIVLTVCHADGKVMLQSAIFPVLILGSKQEWCKNPKETYCYSTVVFCHCWRPCDTLRPSPTPFVKG